MKATVINKGDSIDHILDQLRATVLPKDRVSLADKTAHAVPGFVKSIALIDLVSLSYASWVSDCNVTVYPYDISYDELMEQQFDGVIFIQWAWSSSGEKLLSLDPKINGQIPIWGMGLGSTGIGLFRYGAELAPMEVDTGLNIPVREIATGKRDNESKSLVSHADRPTLTDLLVTHEKRQWP